MVSEFPALDVGVDFGGKRRKQRHLPLHLHNLISRTGNKLMEDFILVALQPWLQVFEGRFGPLRLA